MRTVTLNEHVPLLEEVVTLPERCRHADPAKMVPVTGYDVIGDVHGHADRLEALLRILGYRERGGAFRHPDRHAVFVGDLIDRHPQQLHTVNIVRRMVDAGAAQIVLGNHEFNAIAFSMRDDDSGTYRRPHSDKNLRQHQVFLYEVGFDTALHRELVAWFSEIPMWLELDGLRVVHACWSDRHIALLADELGPDRLLTQQAVEAATTEGTAVYEAVEIVLKGPEIDLGGIWYRDQGGHRRTAARMRWWDASAVTLRRSALIPPGTVLHDGRRDDVLVDELPDRPLTKIVVSPYDGAVPVLFGHYWWQRGAAEPMNPMATCLDFSVAAGGDLVAYRFDGEPRLDPGNLVWG